MFLTLLCLLEIQQGYCVKSKLLFFAYLSIFLLQIILLEIFNILFKIKYFFFKNKTKKIDWVFGVEEVASILRNTSSSIPNSLSINFGNHRFYDFNYDYNFSNKNKLIFMIERILFGPILLAKFSHLSSGFFYIWSSRFLINKIDDGEYEYSFLKKKDKLIVNFFVGSDIRSPQKAMEFAKERGDEVTSNYYYLSSPHRLNKTYEEMIKNRCEITEKYSNMIITSKVDQASYFIKKTYPFIYFYPDKDFHKNDKKYQNIKTLKVVHAPSSPIIKGTQLVRSAILRLKKENYIFEYVELINISNDEIKDHLKTAHIVLNEFYAHVPGVFGIEALANYSALMTSADENIETDLPINSNNAWLVTKSYEIYDNLKFLMNNHHEIKACADRGFEWARKHASQENSGKLLSNLLSDL